MTDCWVFSPKQETCVILLKTQGASWDEAQQELEAGGAGVGLHLDMTWSLHSGAHTAMITRLEQEALMTSFMNKGELTRPPPLPEELLAVTAF